MKEDTVVSMDYAAPAIGRFEAENCEILDANGNKISGSIVSGSGNRRLLRRLQRVEEPWRRTSRVQPRLRRLRLDKHEFHTRFHLRRREELLFRRNAAVFYDQLVERDESGHMLLGYHLFPGWLHGQARAAEGHRPRLLFLYKRRARSRDNLDANTVPAVDAEMAGGKVQDDKMAYLGQSALLAETGDAIVIKSPCDGNVVNIKYKAGAGCELEISVNGKSAGTISLEDTELLRYVHLRAADGRLQAGMR